MKVVRRSPDKGYLDNMLWVPKGMANIPAIRSALTIEVQEGPNTIQHVMYKETDDHIIVPRNFLLEEIPFELVDCRTSSFQEIQVKSNVQLDAVRPNETTQQDSVKALAEAPGGVLQLSCGKGKSVVALHLVSVLRVPTIIVVDTMELVRQWKEEIEKFLELNDSVGMFCDGTYDWKHDITIATYHSLAYRSEDLLEEMNRHFGLAVYDESHHAGAPVFSRGASLFHGKRIGLTATPNRTDGLDIIANMHFGPILYKDILMDVIPEVRFEETGISLPETEETWKAVSSKTGEMHLGKLSQYLATREDRLTFITNRIRKLREEGRKVLVLSTSVNEILNLACRWAEIPDRITQEESPTPASLGYSFEGVPERLPSFRLQELQEDIEACERMLAKKPNPIDRSYAERRMAGAKEDLLSDEIARKIDSIQDKRRNDFIKKYLTVKSDAGIMVHKAGSSVRADAIKNKMVTFAIMKYGKEGLNSKELDTVLVCEPITDRNAVQQLLGRPSRLYENKKKPLVIFLMDNIGLLIGMCRSLQATFRQWPVEEGGPINYSTPQTYKAFRRGR